MKKKLGWRWGGYHSNGEMHAKRKFAWFPKIVGRRNNEHRIWLEPYYVVYQYDNWYSEWKESYTITDDLKTELNCAID